MLRAVLILNTMFVLEIIGIAGLFEQRRRWRSAGKARQAHRSTRLTDRSEKGEGYIHVYVGMCVCVKCGGVEGERREGTFTVGSTYASRLVVVVVVDVVIV